MTAEEFAAAMEAKNRGLLPPMAPAQGLCLERVVYPGYPEI